MLTHDFIIYSHHHNKVQITTIYVCISGDNFTLSFDLYEQSDDIRTKGKELVEPKFEGIREQLVPLKAWVCQS